MFGWQMVGLRPIPRHKVVRWQLTIAHVLAHRREEDLMAKSSDSPGEGDTQAEETHSVFVIPEDVAAMSYEQARDELVMVVAQLEVGGAPLEDALALWERGEVLAAHCQRFLELAMAKDDDRPELATE